MNLIVLLAEFVIRQDVFMFFDVTAVITECDRVANDAVRKLSSEAKQFVKKN
jgi:hypothetical protein